MTGRVDKVSALLQSLGAGDVQPVLAEFDDDIVMRLPSLGFVARGRAAVAEQLEQTAGQVSISRLVHVVEHGPFVVALYDVASRPRTRRSGGCAAAAGRDGCRCSAMRRR